MSMATKIRTLAVSAICLTVCSSLATALAAQQQIPNAPRLQQFRQPSNQNAQRVPQVQQPASPGTENVQAPQQRAVSQKYAPKFMRPTGNPLANSGQVVYPVAKAGFGTPYTDPAYIDSPDDGYFVDDGYYADPGFNSHGGGGQCDSCSTCFGGSNADCYECGPAIDPRDCGIADDCWMKGLGGLFCNSEFFVGAHGFKNQVFSVPGANREPENSGFGLHAGFNTGLPLYRITCGIVSGQIGVSTVQSNFEDGFLSNGDRQQTFITAGLFRRVDYGLQFGAVADILHETWVSDMDVVQMRGELSWVWPSGQSLGFRLTQNVQDASGTIGQFLLPGLNAQSIDNYRLFYRHTCYNGGYAETFYGRSDESHSIFGVDFDLPLSSRIALQSGFTYLQPDDVLPLSDNEAWNISLGVSFRPRGRDWYNFYHRPLFDVADNGSMIISRK